LKEVVAGVDEVGRGCLAGPVIAAAGGFKQEYNWPKMTQKKFLLKKDQNFLN
jgi:ribonuclease HII